jgi:hypothetical protein
MSSLLFFPESEVEGGGRPRRLVRERFSFAWGVEVGFGDAAFLAD